MCSCDACVAAKQRNALLALTVNTPAPMTLAHRLPARPGRLGDPAVLRASRAVGVPLVLSLFALVPHFAPGLSELLQYDRAALVRGEAWRWLTCHWTHWSADHLLWDVTTFLVLGWACARRNLKDFGLAVALSTLTIPAAVWLAHPELTTYRGLSGVDSALLALLAVDALRAEVRPGGRRIVAWACAMVLLGFGGKLLYEVAFGAALFVNADEAGFVPVPLAHAVGAGVGGAVALFSRRR